MCFYNFLNAKKTCPNMPKVKIPSKTSLWKIVVLWIFLQNLAKNYNK